MPTDLALVLGVAGVAILLIGSLFVRAGRGRALGAWGFGRSVPLAEPLAAPADLRPLAAVVVNPTKFSDDGAAARAVVREECLRFGWQEPLWLPTTIESPGRRQAAMAIEVGADLVLACGGDGTVRQVAQALADTGVPLGLLPAGTGNLLARNLDLRLDDLRGATRVALTGDDRAVDVGRIRFDDDPAELFLVMAGMGFDATMMNTPEHMKARVGPVAYLVSGARHLYGRSTRVSIEVDTQPLRRRAVRAVIVGNCGRLLGGVVLMPDARIDDGLLDLVTIAPRGVVGWGNVGTAIVTRHRKGHSMLERAAGQWVNARAVSPMPVEVDGDVVGWATSMSAWVDPGALVVRVPETVVQDGLAARVLSSVTAARNRSSTTLTTSGAALNGSETRSARA